MSLPHPSSLSAAALTSIFICGVYIMSALSQAFLFSRQVSLSLPVFLALLLTPQSARSLDGIDESQVQENIASRLTSIYNFSLGSNRFGLGSDSILSGLEVRTVAEDFELLAQESLDPEGGVEGEEINVLVSEVAVTDLAGELLDSNLEDAIFEAITTEAGRTTTRSQLQRDINNIFAVGIFANVRVLPEDTPLGVRVTFVVQPNPVLARVEVTGNDVLPDEVVDEIFSDQYGEIIDLIAFQDRIVDLNEWYQGGGYVLAQVLATPEISADGVVTLVVAEGVIEDILIRYINREGFAEDEEGNPILGRTYPFIITREIKTEPGQVFQQEQIQSDLQRVFGLGVFDDINLSLAPGSEDPRQVTMIINVVERNTGSIQAGVGFTFSGGTFLSTSYAQENFLGQAQKIALSAQFSNIETVISGSLNSVGDKYGNPNEARAFHQSIFSVHDLLEAGNHELAAEYSESILRIARLNENKALEALVLNNLGDLYSGSQKIQVYNEALKLSRDLQSPLLELIVLLQQSNAYSSLGQESQALNNQIQAFTVVQSINQSDLEIEDTLDQKIAEKIYNDWQIEEAQLRENIKLFASILEVGLLASIASAYNTTGDYQASLYTVYSSELIESSKSFSNYQRTFFGDPQNVQEFFNIEDEDGSEYIISTYGTALASFVSDLPDFYKAFIGPSLLENNELYEESVQQISNIQREEITELSFIVLSTLVSEDFSSSLNLSYTLSRSLARIRILLDDSFDFESRSWDQDSLKMILSEVIDALDDEFIRSYFFEQVINSESTREISDYLDVFSGSATEIISIYLANKSPIEFNSRVIEILDSLLNQWPDEAESLQKIEWAVKGLILKFQADSYYLIGNYRLAANTYEEAVYWLMNPRQIDEPSADTSDISAIISTSTDPSNFVGTDNSIQFTNGTSNLPADTGFRITREIVDSNPLLNLLNTFDLIEKSHFEALSKQADSYFNLSQLNKAKDLYHEALGLMEKERENVIFEPAEEAEIYYKIAQSRLLAGEFDLAKSSIEESISINEMSFPNVSSSGVKGLVSLKFIYGYGVPYQGSIAGQLNLRPRNQWAATRTIPSALNKAPCNTVLEYFVCKQKYFDLYISLLIEKHQENPYSGYDFLAFEASEKAREFNIVTNELDGSQKLEQLTQALSFDQIRKSLNDEETIILEFFLGQDKSYLWLVEGDGKLQTYELPSRSEIESKSKEFYALITSPSGRVRPATTSQVGDELSRMLLGQVADKLGNKRLVIVADGFLQYLPFNVLPNPATNTAPTESALQGEFAPVLNPLLLEHEIVYLPSASSLVNLRENASTRPEATQELALFANPVFSHKDARVDQVKLFESAEPFTEEDLADIEVLYSELPDTKRELDTILNSNLIPDDQVQTFFGYDADLEAALSPELGQFRIVHFASHGIFNSNAPERSGVVLSGISEDGIVQPGLLSPTYAFNEMNLAATELVVLSGCRTGLSQGQIGREGMTGLTNGLFDAGAERVVASLWSVRDDATRELMKRFYQRMLDPENPMRPAEALRDAQISMWNEPRWQTPYNWAAFTLQGEWR
jgi:CHAT domain-containing protein